jgi:ribose transport system ATP-binding protein
MVAETAPRLVMSGIVKSFPGVRALRGVDLDVRPGEVLALIGENGAGKSTLMKILAGIESPDAGRIVWEGREVRFGSVRDSLATGIALIHQELNLAANLSLAENIFLGREPATAGWIRSRSLNREAARFLNEVGLGLPPTALAGRLSIGQQQQAEIAKALSANARLLIMDEPTSSLSARETEILFGLIARLVGQGVSIIYVSHRMAEIRRLADRIAVLRDGQNAGLLTGEERTHANMVQRMVGRELGQFFPHQPQPVGETRLAVDGLRVEGSVEHPFSFHVARGEIVALAGLVGAGRTEVLETLMGLRRPFGGSISVDGKPIRPGSLRSSIDAGLALVPEDRRHLGLMTALSVSENLNIVSSHQRARLGWLARTADRRAAQSQVDSLGIRTPGLNQVSAFLSGGNQQKIVIGKWILNAPGVLLLDEPTRGVDIGAKQEIYALMERLAKEGAAILFVSSEMEEVIGMADRVLVLHEGRLTANLPRSGLTEQQIMAAAVGDVAVNQASSRSSARGIPGNIQSRTRTRTQ